MRNGKLIQMGRPFICEHCTGPQTSGFCKFAKPRGTWIFHYYCGLVTAMMTPPKKPTKDTYMTLLIDFNTSNVDRERFFKDKEYRAKVESQLKELNAEAEAAERALAEAQFMKMQKLSEQVDSELKPQK